MMPTTGRNAHVATTDDSSPHEDVSDLDSAYEAKVARVLALLPMAEKHWDENPPGPPSGHAVALACEHLGPGLRRQMLQQTTESTSADA
jgi:hypothetical protein